MTRRVYTTDNIGNAVLTRTAAELETALNAVLGQTPRIMTGTSTGLGDEAVIGDDETIVEIDSGGAAWIVQLPEATEARRGREIKIWVQPSVNVELQSARDSGDTINNVDCSGGAVEALLTHTQYYIARQHLATGWLLQAFTALGAVATAIVPD